MGADALRQTEVDGVPVYWVAGEGKLHASLWFRAGMVDETLPTFGRLHLIEHLALHGRESIRTPVNGHVSLLYTAFTTEGDPTDVSRSLTDICTWLADPDWTALEHERRVLQAESAGRSAGLGAAQMIWRYGAQGPGLAAYDQFGLGTADPESLMEVLRTMFVSGNAGLALTGPPPADLRLPLLEGPRVLPDAAVPCDQPTPATFPSGYDGVALSGVLRRSTAAAALGDALQRELHTHFRSGAGVGYSAWQSYEAVDATQAVLMAGIDLLPEAVQKASKEAVGVVRRLMNEGISADDLRDQTAQVVEAMSDDDAGRWQPVQAVREVLAGREVRTRAQLIDELHAVTADDLRSEARDLFATLLITADPSAPKDPALKRLRTPTTRQPTEGHRFPALGATEGEHLRITDRGVYCGSKVGTEASYDDLAVLIAYPDGGRVLIRRDGYQVEVEPTLWREGTRAVALIDAAAPPALRIAAPDRPAHAIPRSPTPRQRALAGVVNHWNFVWPFFLGLLTLASLVVAIAVGGLLIYLPMFFGVAFGGQLLYDLKERQAAQPLPTVTNDVPISRWRRAIRRVWRHAALLCFVAAVAGVEIGAEVDSNLVVLLGLGFAIAWVAFLIRNLVGALRRWLARRA